MSAIQTACDRCTQGVMDADRPKHPGNDHLYGRCRCICHDWEGEMEQTAEWEWFE